jgi:hypothetical protein
VATTAARIEAASRRARSDDAAERAAMHDACIAMLGALWRRSVTRIPLAREVWNVEEHAHLLVDAYFAEVEEPPERGASAFIDLDTPLDQIYVFPAERRVVLGMRICDTSSA